MTKSGNANTVILQPCSSHLLRFVDIPAIEEVLASHHAFQFVQINTPEGIPLCEHDYCICLLRRFHGGVHILDVRFHLLRVSHGHRIMCAYGVAGFLKHRNEIQTRGFAHVIGLWFKAQSPDSDGCLVREHVEEFLKEAHALAGVDLVCCFYNGQGNACFLAQGNERFYILGEAAPAISDACVQEAGADTVIQSEAVRDITDVPSRLFAEFREHVDEGDLGGEERIARILHNLCALPLHVEDGFPGARERLVELVDELRCPLVSVDAHDNAVRLQRVLHCTSFPQEL